jgi:hypothetical protein
VYENYVVNIFLMDSAVSFKPLSAEANNFPEFLGDFEAICKTALAREQGPRGDCLMKKSEGRKSRDTVPLIKT